MTPNLVSALKFMYLPPNNKILPFCIQVLKAFSIETGIISSSMITKLYSFELIKFKKLCWIVVSK